MITICILLSILITKAWGLCEGANNFQTSKSIPRRPVLKFLDPPLKVDIILPEKLIVRIYKYNDFHFHLTLLGGSIPFSKLNGTRRLNTRAMKITVRKVIPHIATNVTRGPNAL